MPNVRDNLVTNIYINNNFMNLQIASVSTFFSLTSFTCCGLFERHISLKIYIKLPLFSFQMYFNIILEQNCK